jgi:hypothetical protein
MRWNLRPAVVVLGAVDSVADQGQPRVDHPRVELTR